MNNVEDTAVGDREIEDMFRAFVFEGCIDIVAHTMTGIPRKIEADFFNANMNITRKDLDIVIRRAKEDPEIMRILQMGYKKRLSERMKIG